MFSLLEEERCGHIVTEDTKKLWSVQMDILKEFQRICQKYNFKYYAIGGTLLGAVRHKGYIPWDDDIDVGMTCDDLDRFCEVVKDELPSYYEFQHFSTQEGFSIGLARIRDKRTTCCTKYEYTYYAGSEEYSMGVFLDIFPLFNVTENKFLRKFQRMITFLPSLIMKGYMVDRKKKILKETGNGIVSKISLFAWKCSKNWSKNARKRFDILNMFEKAPLIGLTGFIGYNNKMIWKKEWFEETVDLPFEDMTITCPKGYDEILKHCYGDYKVFVKGTAIHSCVLVDTQTPYKEKLKEHYIEMKKS